MGKNSNYLYKGKILNLRLDEIKLPNEKVVNHEIIEHRGSVAVLPLYNNEVLMVKQYRSPIGIEMLEIPAGIIEENETNIEAGIRELQEETGAYTNTIKFLGKIYPSPGYTNEVIYLYYTDKIIIKSQSLDEDEFINVERIKFEQVLKMIDNGEIVDAKTIVAILKYKSIKGEKHDS